MLGRNRIDMENVNKETAAPKTEKKAKAPKEPKAAKIRPTPPLSHEASSIFADYKALTAASRAAFTANAREFERVEGVKASKDIATALTVGTRVRVIAGDAKLFGKEGAVTEARRVRIFVQIDGANKPTYLFASDVVPLEQFEVDATETEDIAQAV